MAALLALIASLSWGSADFLGGMAARRVGSLRVLAVSYPAGALVLTPLALWVIPGDLSATAWLWGLAAGVVGAVAMGLLYAALTRGPMGIVSPLTAVLSAAVPVGVGIAMGEAIGLLSALGMVLAATAVVLVSRAPGHLGRVPAGAIAIALAAGGAIGAYLVILGLAPAESGIWVATLGRWIATGFILLAFLTMSSRRSPGSGYPWGAALAAGALDATANGAFQLAAQSGELAVVAVIGSLYPAATVALARIVLGERLSRIQAIGVVLALLAAAALSA